MQQVWQFESKKGKRVVLRPAVPGDAKGIVEVLGSEADERSYVLSEGYRQNEQEEKEYLEQMDRTKNLMLVAVVNNRVAGVLGLFQTKGLLFGIGGDVAEIGLHLAKEYREEGIGTEMLRYALNWASEHGLQNMFCSIFTTNQRSLKLFRNFGFAEQATPLKHRIGSRIVEEVIMIKHL